MSNEKITSMVNELKLSGQIISVVEKKLGFKEQKFKNVRCRGVRLTQEEIDRLESYHADVMKLDNKHIFTV